MIDFTKIDRAMSNAKDGRKSSGTVLLIAQATSRFAKRGALRRVYARSRQTYETLKPGLDYIQSKKKGISYREIDYFPLSEDGRVSVFVTLGENKPKSTSWFNWREAAIHITGRKVEVAVYEAKHDTGPRNEVNLTKCDDTILNANIGKDGAGLNRVLEYVAALAGEGHYPNWYLRQVRDGVRKLEAA